MFWKKKNSSEVANEKGTSSPKSKAPSPKDIIAGQIEQLVPEQVLRYKLPEVYGNEIIIIQLNPQYPQKGKKYSFGTQQLVNGELSGKISHLWDSDKSKDFAGWIIERSGVPFS